MLTWIPAWEVSGTWGCCEILFNPGEPVVQETWAPPIPASRGGQKKEALKRRHEQQEQDNPATNNTLAKSFEHPTLGHLTLTYAQGKSYAVASKCQPGVPRMVVQFTEAQVGANHGIFLEALIYSACCKNLDRSSIKELRDSIIEQRRWSSPMTCIKKASHPKDTQLPSTDQPDLLPCSGASSAFTYSFLHVDKCLTFLFEHNFAYIWELSGISKVLAQEMPRVLTRWSGLPPSLSLSLTCTEAKKEGMLRS